jgi:AraC-type DNA-binding domain-containing proteins
MKKTKELLEFQNMMCISHRRCGKFQAPASEWMHLTRCLKDYELILVTEGTLYIADEVQEYVVQEGEYILMAPTPYLHGVRPSACTFHWLHFGEHKESILQEEKVRRASCITPICIPVHGALAYPERIIILMKQLQDSVKRYQNTSLNNSLLLAILQEIFCQMSDFVGETESSEVSQIVSDSMDYIQYHVNGKVTVNEIAEYFGYSSKYLSLLFKKQIGVSIKQYILQQKMVVAMAALTDTNRTILEIANDVGFEDAHNFSNAFKKIAEVSPKQYRMGFEKRLLSYGKKNKII